MAEFDPIAKAATAQRLIDKYGELCSLTTYPAPTAESEKPWRGAEAPPNVQAGVRAAFLPVSAATPPVEYADGSTSRVGDYYVLVGTAANPAPDVGSVFTRRSGATWGVKRVSPLDPNGDVIMYEVWVTKR